MQDTSSPVAHPQALQAPPQQNPWSQLLGAMQAYQGFSSGNMQAGMQGLGMLTGGQQGGNAMAQLAQMFNPNPTGIQGNGGMTGNGNQNLFGVAPSYGSPSQYFNNASPTQQPGGPAPTLGQIPGAPVPLATQPNPFASTGGQQGQGMQSPVAQQGGGQQGGGSNPLAGIGQLAQLASMFGLI